MDFWTLLVYGVAAFVSLRLLVALLANHRETYRRERIAELQSQLDQPAEAETEPQT